MATLKLRKVHKNGNASYSQEGVRASVYVNKQMFADGQAPAEIEFGAPNLAQPGQSKAAKAVDPAVQAEREAKAKVNAEKAQARAQKLAERAAKAAERAAKAQARLVAKAGGVDVRPEPANDVQADPVPETEEPVAQ